MFNESVPMRYLESMDGAVEYVQVSRRGLQVSVHSKQQTKWQTEQGKIILRKFLVMYLKSLTFLETGQGVLCSQKFDMETIWIDDKPDNVELARFWVWFQYYLTHYTIEVIIINK